MNKLMQTVTENVAYVVIFLAVIVGCFLVAVVLEKSAQKKNGVSEPIFNTRKLAFLPPASIKWTSVSCRS